MSYFVQNKISVAGVRFAKLHLRQGLQELQVKLLRLLAMMLSLNIPLHHFQHWLSARLKQSELHMNVQTSASLYHQAAA